jgi:hypothetical protein
MGDSMHWNIECTVMSMKSWHWGVFWERYVEVYRFRNWLGSKVRWHRKWNWNWKQRGWWHQKSVWGFPIEKLDFVSLSQYFQKLVSEKVCRYVSSSRLSCWSLVSVGPLSRSKLLSGLSCWSSIGCLFHSSPKKSIVVLLLITEACRGKQNREGANGNHLRSWVINDPSWTEIDRRETVSDFNDPSWSFVFEQ